VIHPIGKGAPSFYLNSFKSDQDITFSNSAIPLLITRLINPGFSFEEALRLDGALSAFSPIRFRAVEPDFTAFLDVERAARF
jgi:hypothetical protein